MELADKQKDITNRPKRGMPRLTTSCLAFIVLMIAWWNQPYWGWNYCLLQGVVHETDLVEMLRPRLAGIRTGEAKSALEKAKEAKFAEEKADEAIRMLKQCVRERGIEFCRYVGSNENAFLHTQTDKKRISKEDEYKYRYIFPNASVELSILPTGNSNFGTKNARIGYQVLGQNLGSNYRSCIPGCSCNPSISG